MIDDNDISEILNEHRIMPIVKDLVKDDTTLWLFYTEFLASDNKFYKIIISNKGDIIYKCDNIIMLVLRRYLHPIRTITSEDFIKFAMVPHKVIIYEIINVLDKNIYKMNSISVWYSVKRDISKCFFDLNLFLIDDLENFVDDF